MAHLALYRTYRPQDFESVVGQKHIVQTVKNQIKKDLLAHAYMLTGPRGTGKTSIARIVAKAINCMSPEKGSPCSSCESCLAVANGNHPDVLELDGASNNGVDEIRDIRDRVKYSPSLSPYKVYIIDEVHMLSTGAFNALLKTLEEPPAHVIFMLATTEIHKVPDTILSRVQRFDLKQIPTQDMTEHLERILDELEVEFEEEVPELIASLAAGGLRDALSMLDQAIAYKTDVIKLSDIHDLNGSVGAEALVEIINCVVENDFLKMIETVRTLLALGKLPARIVDGLLRVFCDILKAQKIGDSDLVELAKVLSSKQVLSFIKKLNDLAHELKIATDAELILEVGLIELGLVETAIPDNVGIQNLENQIHELRSEVAKLRELTKTTTVAQVQTPEPEGAQFPVFVQGELVSEKAPDVLTNELSMNEPDTLVVDEPTDQQIETGHQTVGSNDLLIEDVLTHATKQAKEVLQSKVLASNAFANLDDKEVVMLLKDAEVAAASATGCILVYDYETTASQMLSDKNRTKAKRILADMMGSAYGFLALPKEFWLLQRESYVLQKKQGKTPLLEQYSQIAVESSDQSKSSELEVPFYQDVVDMFGDIVEVE